MPTDAGTGLGSAAQATSPPAVAEAQQKEKELPELSFGVSFGDESVPALELTPETQRLLEEVKEMLDAPALAPPKFSRPSEKKQEGEQEAQEEEMPEGEGVEMAAPCTSSLLFCLPQDMVCLPLTTRRRKLQGVPAAAGQCGFPYSSKVWKHFQLAEDSCFAQCSGVGSRSVEGEPSVIY